MRYGTVPIVRYTGGLADTVQEFDTASGYGNGFVFGPYEDIHMLSAIDRAQSVYRQPDKWKKLVQINMKRDYSWEHSAHQYLDFYRQELGLV
jgi:starch synthase